MNSSYDDEFIDNIVNDPVWSALLHLKDQKAKIQDPNFLLSYPKFNAKQELLLTLAELNKPGNTFYCRFPARFSFLSQYFSLSKPDINTMQSDPRCAELLTYQRKVPSESISVVYASEVLSSASSMMGHVFLKAEGDNDNGKLVQHSISFFTEFSTFNPLTLLYDGLFGGMDGFLIVRPYESDRHRYGVTEQRNVFEYTLQLDPGARQRIMAHVWELKDVEVKYLFQSYNCATLTLYVLGVGEPKLRQHEKWFVSPADVVKAVENEKLISHSFATLANKWSMRFYRQSMSEHRVMELHAMLQDDPEFQHFPTLSLNEKTVAISYLASILESEQAQQRYSESQLKHMRSRLEQWQGTENVDLSIDFSSYKNPIEAPQDSIVGVSVGEDEQSSFVDFSLLPASHYLRGDNKQFFSESELKIGAASIRFRPETNSASINELTLYSVVSYVPSSEFQPEWSGSFYLGYKRDLTETLERTGYLTLSGGIGKTYLLHKDMMVYGMLGVGVSANKSEQLLFTEPQVGVILNLAYQSKFRLQHTVRISTHSSEPIHHSNAELSWSGTHNHTFSVAAAHSRSNDLTQHTLSFTYDYHF